MNREENAPCSAVNTHNMWDPLEEVVVGTVEGAVIPPWDVIMEATLHRKELWDFFKTHGGTPWPQELLDAAQKDVDEFVHFGIEWLRRHLGDDYRVHEVEVNDTHPMHIDATFYPLAPGKLLINPERVPMVPELFRKSGWDILVCPTPLMPESHPMYNSSPWISMNVLMLDEERVIVSEGEDTLIRALKEWGFKPIPCNFYNFATIGGGFHCASLDIRRKGELKSCF
jgi:hypothetical protein